LYIFITLKITERFDDNIMRHLFNV